MSSAYRYKYPNVVGILPLCGVFALGPATFQLWNHVAVAEHSFVFCNHILPINKARHFSSMSIKPQSLCLFGLCSVDIDNRNVAPFHTYHAMAVDNCMS